MPRLASPPLSPDRVPHTVPMGTLLVGPTGDGGVWSLSYSSGGPCGLVDSIMVVSPSSIWTYWGTSSAGTVAGLYIPYGVEEVGPLLRLYIPGMLASTVWIIASVNVRPTFLSSLSLTVTFQIAVAFSCWSASSLSVRMTSLLML